MGSSENQKKFVELMEELRQQKKLIANKNIELRDCVGQGELLFLVEYIIIYNYTQQRRAINEPTLNSVNIAIIGTAVPIYRVPRHHVHTFSFQFQFAPILTA